MCILRGLRLSIALAVLLAGGALAAAPAQGTELLRDTFTGSHLEGEYEIGGHTGFAGTGTPYSPCLTASADLNLLPVPGCVLGQVALEGGPDPEGSGALRLTDDRENRASFLIDTASLPMDAGLDVRFQIFAYAGLFPDLRGADGISFFLQDADVPVTKAGAFGGSLGYAQKVAGTETGVAEDVPGVAGGYVGLGFDEFGNFANDNEGRGHGCGPPGPDVHGLFPDYVALRGPGEGIDGYCLLERTPVAPFGGIDDAFARHREAPGVRRDVHIEIDPLDRADPHIRVYMDFLREDDSEVKDEVLDKPLPPDRPGRVRFGFAASTGGLTNVHEIRALEIDSIEPLPELHLRKTVDGPIEAGGAGSFGLHVSVGGEPGAVVSEPITVRDTIPGGGVAGEVGGEGWDCTTPAPSKVLCTYTPAAPIPVGTTLPAITVPVHFPPEESCTFENEGVVESEDDALSGVEATGAVRFAVRPVGVDDSAVYRPGEPVAIRILDNDRGALVPGSVKVSAAAHGTAVWVPGADGGTLIYTPDPGSTASEHLTYTAADACGQQIDPTPIVIDPEAPQPPGPEADLVVDKMVTPAETAVGGLLRYTATVTNRGPAAAADVTLVDAPEGRVALVDVATDTGTCSRTVPVRCALGTLAAGATANVHVVLRALEAGELANQATATAPNADPRPGDDSSVADVTVTSPRAELTLSKRATRATVRPGRTVAFVLTVGARPGADARRVRVCDRVPAALEVVRAPGAEREGRRLCWTVPRLAQGTSLRFQFLARLRRGATTRLVHNVAIARAANAASRRAVADVTTPSKPRPVTG